MQQSPRGGVGRFINVQLWVLLLGTAMLSACAGSSPVVELKGERYRVEIADDPAERQLGLMFRDHLDADAGMFFIFPRAAPRAFWMKNCRIPLDILFFDADLRLINAHYSVPPCRSRECPSYPSAAPAKYVLELNGGEAAGLNLEPGDRLIRHW